MNRREKTRLKQDGSLRVIANTTYRRIQLFNWGISHFCGSSLGVRLFVGDLFGCYLAIPPGHVMIAGAGSRLYPTAAFIGILQLVITIACA
jgi:hypothetical protein